MAVAFTTEQKKAIETTGKALCVSACAGSGKTTVLIERYKRLVLEQGIPPREILAITFTDKAAQNMKERLVRAFAKTDCPLAIRHLEGAMIMTIHSFCRHLLSEYPFEAQIAPEVSILDESGADILKMEVMEAIVHDPSLDERLVTLMTDYGIDFGRGISVYDQVIAAYKKIRSSTASLSMAVPLPPVEPVRERLLGIIARMEELAGQDKRSFPDKKKAALRVLREMLGRMTEHDGKQTVALLYAAGQDIRSSKKYAALFDEFHEVFDDMMGMLVSRAYQDKKDDYERLIGIFHERYETIKCERAVLDFDDLLIKTQLLLSADTDQSRYLRMRLQRRFRHILLDEYQDTNKLQFGIIEAIGRCDNVFYVGDIRQSIYGFRGADVSIMRAKQREYAENTDAKELVALRHTHRTSPKITDFINGFYDAVREDIIYDDFRPVQTSVTEAVSETPVRVLVTYPEPGEKPAMESLRFREAETIAQEIQSLIAGRAAVRADSGECRPVAYRDIALLFRSTSNMAIYESVLRKYRLPYTIIKGSGFYQAAEIRDLIAVFQLLERPGDDLVCAAVLRSPLVAISDDALFLIACAPEAAAGETFFTKVCRSEQRTALAEDDREKVNCFLELFHYMRQKKAEQPLSELIDYVLAQTQYELYLLQLDDCERKLANVAKLRDIARTFDRTETLQVREFIRYTENMLRQEVEEGEENIQGDNDDCIRIMTIHKAKGLEFPVVVVADMGMRRTMPPEGYCNYSPEHGLGMAVWADATFAYIRDYPYVRNLCAQQERDREEEYRILYVALTRARDYLILSGAVKSVDGDDEEGFSACSSWLELIIGYVAQRGMGAGKGTAIDALAGIQCRWTTTAHDRPATAHPRPQGDFALGSDDTAVENDETRAALVVKNCTPLVIPVENKKVFTVTEIASYMICPRKYYFRYIHPVTALLMRSRGTAAAIPRTQTEQGTKSASGKHIGTVFHAIMKQRDIRTLRPDDIADILSRYAKISTVDEQKRLARWLSYIASDEVKEILRVAQIREWHQELPFYYTFGENGMLSGQIDVLAEYVDGRIALIDYKTTGLDVSDDEYLAQLQLYGLASMRLLQKKECSLVLCMPQRNECVEQRMDTALMASIEKLLDKTVEDMHHNRFIRNVTKKCGKCTFCHICDNYAEHKKEEKPE